MAQINNIRIILSNGSTLDYEYESLLDIKLNRIVDDLTDPSKRYSDFSYTFNLPRTKKNDNIFEFPDVKGRIRIFIGKTFECEIFNNSVRLLEGIIELVGINDDTYQCRLYSKVSQFIDEIKTKNLNDMEYLPTIDWNYEETIIEHIKVAPVSEHIEFPFIFYKTPFMSGATNVNTQSGFIAEANLGFFYNYVISTLPFGSKNPFYEAQFPPAIYLKSIIDGIFSDAGWTYKSSFFDREDIQKIIIPFTGKGEDFTGSVISGETTNRLNLNKLLPSKKQSDFLKTILNTFNLYLIPNPNDKSVSIETYNTLFSNNSNPYKINVFDYEKLKIEDDIAIILDEDDNSDFPLGFNRIMDYSALSNINPTYNVNTCIDIRLSISQPRITTTYKKDVYQKLWQKTTGEKEIKIGLSPVNYYPYNVINERTIFEGATTIPPLWTVGIPLISKQTPQDNDGNNFAADKDDNYVVGNDPNNYSYNGDLKMLYYYGKASWNATIDGGSSYKDWLWVGIATGGTVTVPTFARLPICIASPFRLLRNSEYNQLISGNLISSNDRVTEIGAEAHSVLLTYLGAGTTNEAHSPTFFSLTFGENSLYDNIYSVFHKPKIDDYKNNYLLKGTMRMNENDWYEMQINRTLLFDDELYRLVSIKEYDPILNIAKIEIIKKT
jgi:hypothetical protein